MKGLIIHRLYLIVLQLYSTCWLSDRYVLVGGSQKHCSSVIDIDNDTVSYYAHAYNYMYL